MTNMEYLIADKDELANCLVFFRNAEYNSEFVFAPDGSSFPVCGTWYEDEEKAHDEAIAYAHEWLDKEV